MIANLTIYLPVSAPDLKTLLPMGKSNAGWFRKATHFDLPLAEGKTRLAAMAPEELGPHLSGFANYVRQITATDSKIQEAVALIEKTQSVYGITLPQPIDEESETFRVLSKFTFAQRGFFFEEDSLRTQSGYLVGPKARLDVLMEPIASVNIDMSTRPLAPQYLNDLRAQTLAALSAEGFKCADSLPINPELTLRPAEEIARRLAALSMLFTYVAAPEDVVPAHIVRGVAKANQLVEALSEAEAAIFALPREEARQNHGDKIGWHTENMLPLAWMFGFEEVPQLTSGQLAHDTIFAMVDFAPGPRQSVSEFLKSRSLRSAEEIHALEDKFYCAHNAVRSAQMGSSTVPENFDPLMDGGTVHERRHALTWAMSPAVAWDDTDLST